MNPSIFAGAMVLIVTLGTVSQSSAEAFRQNEVGYRLRADGTVVVHRTACRGCTTYRREQAGVFVYRRPTADYGQSLPIYQPPIYAHPQHVVPVHPLRPRSGPYAVTGASGSRWQHQPMGAQPAYYPSGSGARVIRLRGPALRQPQ